MDLQHKSVKFQFKATENRTIEGYASVFGNVDSTNDIVMPGAFIDSLQTRMPKMLYQHDTGELIGVWDEVHEDQTGLFIKGRLANTECGNEAYELAKMGALDSMSIGYTPTEFEYDGKGVRLLKKVELWEVSLVTFPANDKATITGVKSLEGVPFEELHKNKDRIEAALRDAGASNRAAKYVASLLQPPAQRDVGGEELSLIIQKATQILKGI